MYDLSIHGGVLNSIPLYQCYLTVLNFFGTSVFTRQDNSELFCMMEKTRMYVFRNLDPEVCVTVKIS